jgi:leucyl aminopeptidase
MKLKILKTTNKFKGLVIIPFLEEDKSLKFPEGFGQIEVSKNLFSGKKDTQFIIEDKKNDEDYQMFKLDIKNILTDKEILFIELLEIGYDFDDIANQLKVTKRTVYNIFKPIKEKVIKYFIN